MTRYYWQRYLWAVGLIALFFTGKLVYVMFYTIFLVFLGARWIVRKGFRQLTIKRKIECDHVFKGEDFAIKLEVHNPTWLPLVWVAVTDELPTQLPTVTPRKAVFALAPRQRISFEYSAKGRARGVHQIGPMHVESGDPWGLETLHGSVESFDEVIVYPKVLPLASLGLPSSLPVGEVRTTQRFFEDPARTSGVREYRPGDPLKRMHWKVSARSGELHVREFQPSIALDTTIFLNLNDEEYEIQALGYMSEFAIEVAASLAYYLHQQRQSVGLICNGRDGGPLVGVTETKPIRIISHKGAGQLMRVMEALSRVQTHRGKPFASCLSEEGHQLSWGSTILVVTPEDTPEIVDALFSLRRAGYLIMMLLVGNKVHHPVFLVAPPMPGFYIYRVRHESELDALGHQRVAG